MRKWAFGPIPSPTLALTQFYTPPPLVQALVLFLDSITPSITPFLAVGPAIEMMEVERIHLVENNLDYGISLIHIEEDKWVERSGLLEVYLRKLSWFSDTLSRSVGA